MEFWLGFLLSLSRSWVQALGCRIGPGSSGSALSDMLCITNFPMPIYQRYKRPDAVPKRVYAASMQKASHIRFGMLEKKNKKHRTCWTESLRRYECGFRTGTYGRATGFIEADLTACRSVMVRRETFQNPKPFIRLWEYSPKMDARQETQKAKS